MALGEIITAIFTIGGKKMCSGKRLGNSRDSHLNLCRKRRGIGWGSGEGPWAGNWVS